jgi:alpha-glucosidase
MVKATREGIMAANPDKRPFVLSRAIHLGGQKYGASWTGDNTADWFHMESSIPMVLNMGLSGQPFTGPDIGGFNGDGPSGEAGATMFARWMGVGTLLPFSRAHTMKGAIDKEPWAFGEKTEKTCREAIERRMMLLPYLYTLFHDAATVGTPVARPLFFADPTDPALRSEDDAFLLGDRVMVVAQCVPDRTRVPVLPKGDWVRFTLPNDTKNADLPDMYLRGGAIVPVGPVRQYSGEKALDPLTLYAALDKNGKASGTLYEDAGEGFGYRKGEYLLTTYQIERKGDSVTVAVKGTEGKMARPARALSVVIYADGKVLTGSGRDEEPISFKVSELQAR